MACRRAYAAVFAGGGGGGGRTSGVIRSAGVRALNLFAQPRLDYCDKDRAKRHASSVVTVARRDYCGLISGGVSGRFSRRLKSAASLDRTPLTAAAAGAVIPRHLCTGSWVHPPSRARSVNHPAPSSPRAVAAAPRVEFQTEAVIARAQTESIDAAGRREPPGKQSPRGRGEIGRACSKRRDATPLDSELLHQDVGAASATPAAPAAATTARRVTTKVSAGRDAAASETVTEAPVPNFDDAAASYASFSTAELVRAYVVLRACAIRSLVEHSEALLRIGYATIGENLTNTILGKTFFAHFCAGETADQVGQRAGELRGQGVGGILDYAAEVDLRPAAERAEREAKRKAAGDDRFLPEDPAQCRTYDYMGEEACDARTQTFLTCIRAVRDQTPGGFAAVKLTALGDPVLLSQLTTCVHLVRGLFEDFDVNQDGVVSHEEFEEGYRRWFVSESEEDEATLLRIMKRLDPEGDGAGIDYVEWSKGMRLENLAEITANCRSKGPMAAAALDENGVALEEAMRGRIGTLATAAAVAEVRLMIDAEQSWLQPAIDNTVHGLQREFNQEFPAIFTTYQCYLKDSLERLSTDLDRAVRGGYVWAGKLVRGAYMVSERAKAEEEGYESPVFETIEDTHANYDAAISMVLEHMAAGNRAEVMMATHNQASIEHAIATMRRLGITPADGVSFGQLLGMADNITFPLGARGYKAYKYIPYGRVGETIPYLLRRAQENSGMLGGASHERGLLTKEIARRIFG